MLFVYIALNNREPQHIKPTSLTLISFYTIAMTFSICYNTGDQPFQERLPFNSRIYSSINSGIIESKSSEKNKTLIIEMKYTIGREVVPKLLVYFIFNNRITRLNIINIDLVRFSIISKILY